MVLVLSWYARVPLVCERRQEADELVVRTSPLTGHTRACQIDLGFNYAPKGRDRWASYPMVGLP